MVGLVIFNLKLLRKIIKLVYLESAEMSNGYESDEMESYNENANQMNTKTYDSHEDMELNEAYYDDNDDLDNDESNVDTKSLLK